MWDPGAGFPSTRLFSLYVAGACEFPHRFVKESSAFIVGSLPGRLFSVSKEKLKTNFPA